MSSSTVALNIPHQLAEPRGAAPLADLFASALQWVTQALPDPRNRIYREAAAVRVLAREYEGFDARMASDLYIAADRHELTA